MHIFQHMTKTNQFLDIRENMGKDCQVGLARRLTLASSCKHCIISRRVLFSADSLLEFSCQAVTKSLKETVVDHLPRG